jgi:hypothetical protein
MNMRIDPEQVRQQISNLLLQFPDLAEDELLRTDMIEAETEAFDFLAQIVTRIEDTEALSEGTAQRIKELSERKGRFEQRKEALRYLAFKIMTAADIKKAELPCATLSVRNGAAKVVVHDEASLPADCIKTVTSPDKAAIKDLLASGRSVPGAYLSNGEPSLSIRVK